MADQSKFIDVTEVPEILRLAEEVRRVDRPQVLQRDGEDLAMVVPLPRPRKWRFKTPSEADVAAFRSAAGGWKDLIDVDRFIADIYESRRISTRPPAEL